MDPADSGPTPASFVDPAVAYAPRRPRPRRPFIEPREPAPWWVWPLVLLLHVPMGIGLWVLSRPVLPPREPEALEVFFVQVEPEPPPPLIPPSPPKPVEPPRPVERPKPVEPPKPVERSEPVEPPERIEVPVRVEPTPVPIEQPAPKEPIEEVPPVAPPERIEVTVSREPIVQVEQPQPIDLDRPVLVEPIEVIEAPERTEVPLQIAPIESPESPQRIGLPELAEPMSIGTVDLPVSRELPEVPNLPVLAEPRLEPQLSLRPDAGPEETVEVSPVLSPEPMPAPDEAARVFGPEDRSRPPEAASAPAPAGAGRPRLYAPDGGIQLPEGVLDQIDAAVGDERTFDFQLPTRGEGDQAFARRTPLEYEPTRFEKYWKPDQNLLDELLTKAVEASTTQVSVPMPGSSKTRYVCTLALLAFSGSCGLVSNGDDYIPPGDDPDTLNEEEDRQCQAWWERITGPGTQEQWRKTRDLYEKECRKPLAKTRPMPTQP